MTENSIPRALPTNVNIAQVKKQAKALKKRILAGDSEAIDRISTSHLNTEDVAEFSLKHAHATIAREYGFDGWHQLTDAVAQIAEERGLHRWLDDGGVGRIRS